MSPKPLKPSAYAPIHEFGASTGRLKRSFLKPATIKGEHIDMIIVDDVLDPKFDDQARDNHEKSKHAIAAWWDDKVNSRHLMTIDLIECVVFETEHEHPASVLDHAGLRCGCGEDVTCDDVVVMPVPGLVTHDRNNALRLVGNADDYLTHDDSHRIRCHKCGILTTMQDVVQTCPQCDSFAAATGVKEQTIEMGCRLCDWRGPAHPRKQALYDANGSTP